MAARERGARRIARLTVTALTALRPRSRRSLTFWLIVAVNVSLIALYVWSRDGSATNLRIELDGAHYEAYADGKLFAQGEFRDHPRGGIGFLLRRNDRIASVAGPVGIDFVRVTNATRDRVLLEDNFDGGLSDEWEIGWGEWRVDDGVLTTDTGGLVRAGSAEWGNFVLEARLRNLEDASVFVWMEDVRNALKFEMFLFRSYRSNATLLGAETGDERRPGAQLELDRGETIRGIAATVLQPYPTMLVIIVAAIALAAGAHAARLATAERRIAEFGQTFLSSSNAIVFVMVIWALILLWYINYFIADHMPHVPDSVMYVFQSKIFASFQLTADAPPVRQSFSIFHPAMDQVVDGRWFTHYPFGHPMLLAIGQLVRAPWLVPPALGAACIGLIYFVGKRVYGTTAGLLAAALLLVSPFFQMTASNFMSHNSAVFTILACLALLVLPVKRRVLAMFFSGIFLGLLFNIRPLSAVALIPVLGALLAYELIRAGPERMRVVRQDLAFGAGGLVMLALYFLYNKATSGSFIESPYAVQGTYSDDYFGFGGEHSVAFGLQNQKQLLSLMLLVAQGWPALIGLGFAALPFVLGTRQRWDYFLGASLLAIASANIFYRNAAVMHGPRFWYETMPFLMLLTARGALLLRDRAVVAGGWLGSRLRGGPPVETAGVTGLGVLALVGGLMFYSATGWMLEWRDAWAGVAFTPPKISSLRGFNFTDDRLIREAERQDLEDALVLVEQCANWWCFGSVFWTNSIDLDGDIVWAERQNNEDDRSLLQHFAGRDLYLADYDSGAIRAVTEEELLRPATATPTPQGSPGERDERRRSDLSAVAEALREYYAQHGEYPSSAGRIEALCATPGLDAGCSLAGFLTTIPSDPLGAPSVNGYWYTSDGRSFTLIAQYEGAAGAAACSQRILAEVEDAGYCIEGGAP